MFPNIIQQDRRSSIMDEQLLIYNKNIHHTPEQTSRRIQKRQSSKIGSQSQITRNQRSKLQIDNHSQSRKATLQSQKNRQNNLYQEYSQQQTQSSDSNSSQDEVSKKSKVQQKGPASIINYDKVIDEQMEFIHKTLHQQLSSISKQKATSFLKSSQNSQMKQTMKSMKSFKQLSSYSKKSSFQSKLNFSTKFNRERSISTSKNVNSDAQELKSLVKILDQAGIPEQEQGQYKQIIEELEKQCAEIVPTGRNRIKQKVRKTFVHLFNQYYKDDNQLRGVDGDQMSVCSVVQNESLFFGNQKHDPYNMQNSPSNINMTSILDNVFTKTQNHGLMSDRMKLLIDNFKLEISSDDSNVNAQSEQSSEIEVDEEEEYLERQFTQTIRDPTQQQDHQILKYERKYKRDPIYDPYPLIWQSKEDYKWIVKDYQLYWDNYPLVWLRKTIVFIIRIIANTAYKIINHRIFTILVLISIVFNIMVFIESQNDNLSIDVKASLRQQKQIILFFFIGENILKLIGQGMIDFFWDLQNVFDIIILILFSFHYYYPTFMIIDFSTARLLKILSVISVFSKRLQIMLLALKHSLRFLLEALIIVLSNKIEQIILVIIQQQLYFHTSLLYLECIYFKDCSQINVIMLNLVFQQTTYVDIIWNVKIPL